jgi:hypothetical protein
MMTGSRDFVALRWEMQAYVIVLIVVPIQITPERIDHERKHHGQPRPSISQNGVTRPYRTGQKRICLSLNSPQILTCKSVLPTSTALENDVFSK